MDVRYAFLSNDFFDHLYYNSENIGVSFILC